MVLRHGLPLAVLLALLPPADAAEKTEPDAPPRITIWLMPNEPAADDSNRPYDRRSVEEINSEIDDFGKLWGPGNHVTVLNVSQPFMREQLPALNRHFVTPFWPVVKGQQRVLAALEKFAVRENVYINVRIVDWTPAFDELYEILAHPEQARQPVPDVVQIGSTWRAFFVDHQMRQSPTPAQKGNLTWKAPRQAVSEDTLPIILDVRLLFYWKRHPRQQTQDGGLTIDATSWETIVASLDKHLSGQTPATRLPPIALPILIGTTNVLHDYVPLVWAGGGDFLRPGAKKIDVTSDAALHVPRYLASTCTRTDSQGRIYRLFAFPEASHYEVTAMMMNGQFGGCIEPPIFLRHFREQFAKFYPRADFEACVGIVAPPTTFLGGSDLMVTRRVARPADLTDKAFAAARVLAAGDYKEYLADLGHLPIHMADFGVPRLLESLKFSPQYQQDVTKTILAATAAGREYAPSPSWPTVLESWETRQKLTIVWQRISEGAGEDQLRLAAADLQHAVNVRMDPSWTGRLAHLREVLPWLVGSLLVTGTVIAVVWGRHEKRQRTTQQVLRKREQKASTERETALDEARRAAEAEREMLKQRNRALEEMNNVRVFSSAALHIVDIQHNQLRAPASRKAMSTAKKKAAMGATLLRDWDRSLNPRDWDDGSLLDSIWHAILSACDSTKCPGLFDEWRRQEDRPTVSVFMTKTRARRPELDRDLPVFCVDCPGEVTIATPIMLEQALVCLVQNAIQYSFDDDTATYTGPVTISFQSTPPSVVVGNRSVSPLPFQNLINDACGQITSFRKQVLAVYQTRDESEWPGLGLIQAYCIAARCYGGLAVTTEGGETHFRLCLCKA